jgi:methionyl-tRNA synthetase
MNILNSGSVVGLGFGTAAGIGLMLIVIWSLFWKGLALWHSGRRGQAWWFVIMLVVNTLGILEIIYLFVVCKLKFSELFKK